MSAFPMERRKYIIKWSGSWDRQGKGFQISVQMISCLTRRHPNLQENKIKLKERKWENGVLHPGSNLMRMGLLEGI